MLLKPFIDLYGVKESLIQMIAIALFGNALWNLCHKQRTAQSMINLTGSATLWMAQNIVIHQKLSENVISLGTWITALQETVQIQEQHIQTLGDLNARLKETSTDFIETSEDLKTTRLANQELLKESKIQLDLLKTLTHKIEKIVTKEKEQKP